MCLHRSVVGIEKDSRLDDLNPPRLILTSPPYPGVHVFYHRWQVRGGKETPAPFWIANCPDGRGESSYTFGSRKQRDLASYYENASAALNSIARISDRKTTLAQMIAFSDPSWQLPQYLAIMEKAGFVESKMSHSAKWPDGRIWRSVPNRKWYAGPRGSIPSCSEVVLVHRLARRQSIA